jgi:hypothetical protein
MSFCPRGIAGWRIALLVGLFAAVFATLAGCGGREGPEQRVRAFIDHVVASAEARSLRDFPAYLAPGFRTEGGLTRDEALALVARYLLGHRTIHVFQRIQELELRGPDQARVVLVAALAGAPMAGPEDLARLKADLFRFDLELADLGDGFQVTGALWQRVGLDELLLGR